MRETKQVSINKESLHRHVPMIGMCVFVILAAAMILVSYLALEIPLVPVCTLVILEAVLCACLNRIPIWTHVVVVAVQVAIGFFLNRGPADDLYGGGICGGSRALVSLDEGRGIGGSSMNAKNYQKVLEETLAGLQRDGRSAIPVAAQLLRALQQLCSGISV